MSEPKADMARGRLGFAFAPAFAACAVALLALGAGAAAAASSKSYGQCAGAVINDWLVHEPDVVGHYPLHCYREALKQLDSYSDIKGYSNAPEDIQRALAAEILWQKKHHNGTSLPGTTTNSSGGSTPGGGNDGPRSPTGSHQSLVTRLFNKIGPGNAQSVPLPLLVLAGLALLLILAAAGTWIAKRLQARRLAPAPARPSQQPHR
jgi:hypothetical protein